MRRPTKPKSHTHATVEQFFEEDKLNRMVSRGELRDLLRIWWKSRDEWEALARRDRQLHRRAWAILRRLRVLVSARFTRPSTHADPNVADAGDKQ